MALVRFNAESDIYVYESQFGIEFHVATARIDEAGNRVHIDLPHASESKTFSEWMDALRFAIELKALGFLVPNGAIDEMRSEAMTQSFGLLFSRMVDEIGFDRFFAIVGDVLDELNEAIDGRGKEE